MEPLTLRAASLVLLCAGAEAQSFNIDCGDPNSAHGIPAATYGGAASPGVWNGVSAQVTPNLVDTAGVTTGVTLELSDVPMLDACGHVGTSGDDAALFDDRWYFDHVTVSATLTGLEPGLYAVHVLSLMGPCVAMFAPLEVEIANALPDYTQFTSTQWSGAPMEGENYSTQFKAILAGEELEVFIYSSSGFSSYTQFCGLQVVRLGDTLEPFCFGDGSGTSCPCSNPGASNAGCAHSGGVGGRLVASGTTSVGADDLRFTAHALPVGQPVLLFAGDNAVAGGAGAVFGDGLRCAGGNAVRLGVRTANAQGLAFWGPGVVGQAAWSPGDVRVVQAWFRDPPGPCSSSFNLTHGVRATVMP